MQYRFFAGKGGVGKTSCAAATALREAERGADVLLVSTDPAHSLGDALGRALGPEARGVPVRGRGRLRALEMDADAALDRWIAAREPRLREIASRGTYLSREEIDRFFRLSLPGVDELVGLVELERLRRELEPERVIVDTAPTGHALRLLDTPALLAQLARVLDDMQEKHRQVASALAVGRYREDAEDALIAEIEGEARDARERLRDPERAAVRWVALPEALSVEETRDGLDALASMGVRVDEIVVNRVTPMPRARCARCEARIASERDAIGALLDRASAPVRLVPRLEGEPRGIDGLRALGEALGRDDHGRGLIATKTRATRPAPRARPAHPIGFVTDASLRLALFGGKGGVGKTSCAAAAAIAIAEQHPDRRVLLLSTDPAHSLGDALELRLDDEPRPVPGVEGRLDAREIDATAELARRKEEHARGVDAVFDALRGGSRLDPVLDRAIVHDLVDLAPPGIDELFSIVAILDALDDAYDLVIVDTAPWGHTERLLALPATVREWVKALLAVLLEYRGVIGLGGLAEDLVALSRSLGRVVETWRDPARTAFVPVTRAAALPRAETERLLGSLASRGMRVPSVIVVADDDRDGAPRCGPCARALADEADERRALRTGDAKMVRAPLLAVPPRGVRGLRAWAREWEVAR
ncbi:ArsA family ATPase [Sandaracinus amylolyticus]|uniref:arsenite-transporting ATPase n=1 Tax=Sandaracinus amylolyticus TaxID=927083 RepID=A0A0F6W8M3_9BACT|nr:ArsA family ATPase [Sandaracinus amylolyticus]AKF10192.1 Arsenical pump-driving ATPase [Sandaracinus amylolyticus]